MQYVGDPLGCFILNVNQAVDESTVCLSLLDAFEVFDASVHGIPLEQEHDRVADHFIGALVEEIFRAFVPRPAARAFAPRFFGPSRCSYPCVRSGRPCRNFAKNGHFKPHSKRIPKQSLRIILLWATQTVYRKSVVLEKMA